ncbi:hypothetical protein [Taklimakanibacter albus]|uniref:Uncharacterized protein n=1 Tax=Taklimakanibacter albus TaxID=2800327 RepID=A0ACC5RGD6_9HYPH|nr:hypothetical protein [Aestuariivirga sp. YIM B02566]MBK1871596.1 hypothetical protein [Aestuariivirga sp. YIM B02566]
MITAKQLLEAFFKNQGTAFVSYESHAKVVLDGTFDFDQIAATMNEMFGPRGTNDHPLLGNMPEPVIPWPVKEPTKSGEEPEVEIEWVNPMPAHTFSEWGKDPTYCDICGQHMLAPVHKYFDGVIPLVRRDG